MQVPHGEASKGDEGNAESWLVLDFQCLLSKTCKVAFPFIKGCPGHVSKASGNLRVIRKAFHSILRLLGTRLAGRPVFGGGLLNWLFHHLLVRTEGTRLGASFGVYFPFFGKIFSCTVIHFRWIYSCLVES